MDLSSLDSHTPLVKGWLQEKQDILFALEENVYRSQNHTNIYEDRSWTERVFKVGEMVFL